jgi:hypothetical protein
MGVDGDWVDRAALKIPSDQFTPFDLRNKFVMDRTLDLAISVETAEHLPPERGEGFVADLWPWRPSFYSQPRFPAKAARATSTNDGRITGPDSLRNTTISLWTA